MSKTTQTQKTSSKTSAKEATVKRMAAEVVAATQPKKEANKSKKAPAVQLAVGQGHRNTEDELAAMTIYKKVDANPRREGAIGWHSWNLIKKGMTVAEYIDAGGRMKDLRWDIAKGYIEVR